MNLILAADQSAEELVLNDIQRIQAVNPSDAVYVSIANCTLYDCEASLL